jgi:hypothetical protein
MLRSLRRRLKQQLLRSLRKQKQLLRRPKLHLLSLKQRKQMRKLILRLMILQKQKLKQLPC